MHIPITTPDELVTDLVQVAIGGSGTVLLLVWGLYSWYSTAKDVAGRGAQLHGASRRAREWMRDTPPVARRLALAGTVLMLITQSLWLATTYVVGNVISVMFLYNKKINQSVGAPPPTVSQMFHALQLDAVSGTYLAIAVAGLVVSYRNALRSNSGEAAQGIGCLLGVPGYASAGLGFLYFALALFLKEVAHSAGYTTSEIWLSLAVTIAGATYAASCHFVMGLPERLISRRPYASYVS